LGKVTKPKATRGPAGRTSDTGAIAGREAQTPGLGDQAAMAIAGRRAGRGLDCGARIGLRLLDGLEELDLTLLLLSRAAIAFPLETTGRGLLVCFIENNR